jgi:hypothetical protein
MNTDNKEREHNRAYLESLTIDASIKQWDIFKPDWEYLSKFPAFTLNSLVGQSVGITPYFASPSWVFNRAIPYFEGDRDFDIDPTIDPPLSGVNEERCKQLKEFLRRIHIAVANLAPYGDLKPADDDNQAENTKIKTADFLAFAINKGWDLPTEFSRLPESVTPHII